MQKNGFNEKVFSGHAEFEYIFSREKLIFFLERVEPPPRPIGDMSLKKLSFCLIPKIPNPVLKETTNSIFIFVFFGEYLREAAKKKFIH